MIIIKAMILDMIIKANKITIKTPIDIQIPKIIKEINHNIHTVIVSPIMINLKLILFMLRITP